ncbi:MAG: PHP domain-containing protein [Candidatus Margulisiibacteriota bacterium]
MKFIADFHVHTVASGHAYNTIYDYADSARKKGLKYIAMTDHGPAMAGGPHLYHFQNLRCLPEKIKGVKVLKGIEANITDLEGHLDVSDENLSELDIVIASFHMHLGYSGIDRDKNTAALINVIRNPNVRIIGHPGNPQFPVDNEAIAAECKKNRVFIEINNSSFTGIVRLGSHDNCVDLAKITKRMGWKVVFGSDSHCIDTLGRFDRSLEVAKEAGLTSHDIVNTSERSVREYILKK